jgi:hypothetical protein
MAEMKSKIFKGRQSTLPMTVKTKMNYFNLDGRAHPGRIAMKLGCMEFDDCYTPDHFDHTALKKDMNSWVW